MKTKTIKQELRRVTNQWLESLPEEISSKIKDKIIITGGSIASMLLKEDVNDFDIYFRDQKSVEIVADHYLQMCDQYKCEIKNTEGEPLVQLKIEEDRVNIFVKSEGILEKDNFNKCKEDQKYSPLFATSNAITLEGKIQLVLRFYGEPEIIHKNYDFVHCTNYWKSWDGELVLHKEALECLLSKELRYVGSLYPICSILRIKKFINRQWHINAGEVFKICYQISQLDLDDLGVLEDQLTGVDSSYFNMFIEAIKSRQGKQEINQTYLFSILDKIFN